MQENYLVIVILFHNGKHKLFLGYGVANSEYRGEIKIWQMYFKLIPRVTVPRSKS